jgi:hypothetical protein
VLLSAAAVTSFLVHVPFVLDGFGEGDAARLVNQAAGWHAAGHLTIREYTARVSPLYLHALKLLLDAGVPLRQMPAIMNFTSAALGALTLPALFWLWRRLAGTRAAVIACVLYAFAPAFWQAHLYGMPHLPSFACFLVAAALLHSGFERTGAEAARRFAAATVLLSPALALKADIVLCAPGVVAMALMDKRHRSRNVIACAAAFAVALVGVFAYSHFAVAHLADSGTAEISNWERRFPFTPRAIFDANNRNRTILAVGPVFFAAAAAAAVVAAGWRRHRTLLAVCVAWAAPALLFWGLKMGNSPRHVMAAWAAPLLLTGVVGADLLRDWRVLAAVTAALVVANYFSRPPTGQTLTPGTRLVASAERLQFRVGVLHRKAREFASLDAPRKLAVGYGANPYVVFETLAAAREYTIGGHDLGVAVTVVDDSGRRQQIRAEYLWEAPARVRGRPGWLIWWFEAPVTVVDGDGPDAPARDSTTPPPGRTLPLEPVEIDG